MPDAPIVMCQISNGHISATGELIHFMFCSRVGFSRLADQMVLFPVRSNPGRPSSWKITAALCGFPDSTAFLLHKPTHTVDELQIQLCTVYNVNNIISVPEHAALL